jgi:hypothetical protein
MFEGDVTSLDATELLASVAEHHAERTLRDARLLLHAVHFADLNNPDTLPGGRPDQRDGRERAIVVGGAGCPPISEFAAAEFGAMLGISAGAAMAYIGQALALRHRFPRIWAKVHAGEAIAWRACKVATACLELSEEAAAIVDAEVVGVINSVTPIRLGNIIKAAIKEADPEAARAAAEQKARERGVYIGRSDEHGTKSIYILAATGDVIHFNATVDLIAQALKTVGDTNPLRLRRARAIGILANPTQAAALLKAAHHLQSQPTPEDPATTPTADTPAPSGATAHPPAPDASAPSPGAPIQDGNTSDAGEWWMREPDDEADRDEPPPGRTPAWPSDEVLANNATDDGDGELMDAAARRALNATLANLDGINSKSSTQTSGKAVVYVHLTDHALAAGNGVLRVEGVGPLIAEQLTELIGHRPYIVKPVIDLNRRINVNAYEIPHRLREQLKLIHPVEQFPYGNAETTLTTDLDHIRPYKPGGPPGQTSTTNLAPLRRFTHRLKTHGRWKVRRLDDGALEWTTPHQFVFRVDHNGTRRVHPDWSALR